MAEARWTIPTPHGPVTLPMMQALKVAACMDDLGDGAVWHLNRCGCCVAVHIPGANAGWVVGSEGGADWVVAE